MMTRWIFQSILVMIVVSTPFNRAYGQFGPNPPVRKSAEQLVKISAVADVDRIEPGATFNLAVVFRIDPHWHIYWQNPGEAGLPTIIEVTAPDGFEVGAMRFPRPETFREELGITYGYQHQAVLFVPITAPQTLPAGQVQFEASVSFLVCKSICLMGSVDKTITVATTGAMISAGNEFAEVIATHKKRLPKQIDELANVIIEYAGTRLKIVGPAGAATRVGFLPIEVPGVTYSKPLCSVMDDQFSVLVGVETNQTNSLGEPMMISGLIVLGNNPDDPCYEFEIPAQRVQMEPTIIP